MIYQQECPIDTESHGQVLNLTKLMADLVRNSGVHKGLMNIFNIGSTAAIGTIQFVPELEKDLGALLDQLISPDGKYVYQKNGNAHSHLQASLLGPSLIVPIKEGALSLGAYQAIVLVELDVKPRERRVLVTIMGE